MATKPTIYKQRIALSDLERNYYDSLNLTVALHPSETLERMVTRILAFCLNAQEGLSFTKGLSAVEEPDVWYKTLDEKIELWLDVGEPAFDRVKKASHQSEKVKVYSFNSKSDVWWEQLKAKLSFSNVAVIRFDHEKIKTLSSYIERTADWSITVTGQSAYIATPSGEVDISWEVLMGDN